MSKNVIEVSSVIKENKYFTTLGPFWCVTILIIGGFVSPSSGEILSLEVSILVVYILTNQKFSRI